MNNIFNQNQKYKLHLELFKTIDKKNLPNLILYGYETIGKQSILRELFGEEIKQKIILNYILSSKEIFFSIYKTKSYIEIDLDEIKLHKNVFLKKFIKDISKTNSVTDEAKILIIHNIGSLDKSEQFILRKIIEDSSNTCRFILITKFIDNLIEPIISRCLSIRVEGFDNDEIEKLLNTCDNKLRYFIENSDYNLKEALLEYETKNEIEKMDTEIKYVNIFENINSCVNNIISFIKSNVKITDKSIKKLEIDINTLNLEYNIDYTDINKKIFFSYIKDFDIKGDLLKILLEHEIRIKKGSKGFMHVHSFIFYLKKHLKYVLY